MVKLGGNKLCLLKFFQLQILDYLQMLSFVANNSYLEQLKIFTILQSIKGLDFFDNMSK